MKTHYPSPYRMMLGWAIALAALLSGCQTVVPTPEQQPTATLAQLQPPTATSTLTSPPPTATQPPTETVQPTPTATPLPVDYQPGQIPQQMNPLTGLVPANPQLLERRPLAVKIQIFPRGQRPPWGLSQADIVYDYYQNNGLTRFHAIFYGADAERVGPVRSARLLDSALIQMYKSVFAFGGADQRILSRLFNSPFSDRLVVEGNHCPPMCRIDPNAYNFLVTNTQDLTTFINNQGVDNSRPDLQGMSFQYLPPEGGTPGSQVQVRYSISAYLRWVYDAELGKYLRFQDDAEDEGQGEVVTPLVDRSNEQQISSDNVVVLFAPHQYAYLSGASEIVEIALDGSGTAYLFRDGQAYKLLWSRASADSVLNLTQADGTPFPFKHGNTWFEVVGISSLFTRQEQAGIWRFENRIP